MQTKKESLKQKCTIKARKVAGLEHLIDQAGIYRDYVQPALHVQ